MGVCLGVGAWVLIHRRKIQAMDLRNFLEQQGLRWDLLSSKSTVFSKFTEYGFFKSANPRLPKHKIPGISFRMHGFKKCMSEILTAKRTFKSGWSCKIFLYLQLSTIFCIITEFRASL